ncbi:MAG: response regulator [Chitinivibrionia bacterium]|nr:response regulator [Chitinivibrionia bacterium]
MRRHVSMGLMQQGYHTEPCENGMKGLETLETLMKRNMPLQCAIVDVQLPDIDGIKLLKVIRAEYPQLPVVIITGHGTDTIAQEAKNQMAAAYLEKPFSMEDLTKVLAQMPATYTPAADSGVATPQATPVPAQSTTAYALLTLKADANLMNVYRTLYFQENVVYCDAIRGDFDLVLLLQADTIEGIKAVIDKEITAIPGVADVSLLSVEVPVFGENVHSIIGSVDRALGRDKGEDVETTQAARIRASSYVMVEIEKEKLEAIYPALYFNDQVVYCDYTRGKYDIVLLMKGTSFSEIENTIRTKFKTLDGVLRIKEWPILTLFEA